MAGRISPHHTPKETALQTHSDRPSPWDIFTAWFLAGLQSFGGGSSTFYLLHQTCVARGWLSEEEFVRTWALAQISPGINLLKLTTLVGYKLCGWPGIIAGFVGMLLPSATATVLMTAGFSAIRDQPLVKAAMRGILPATIGLSLAMGIQMGQPLLVRAHREGLPRLGAHLVILAGAALLMAVGMSPVLVILLAGGAAILGMALIPQKAAPEAEILPGAIALPEAENPPEIKNSPEVKSLPGVKTQPEAKAPPEAENLPEEKPE